MSYSRKVKRRVKHTKVFVIVFIIMFILIVKVVPMIILKGLVNNNNNISAEVSKYKQYKTQDFTIVSLLDYLKTSNETENITINFDNSKGNIVTEESYKFKVNISNIEENTIYEIEYGIGEDIIKESWENKEYSCILTEGKNKFSIKIYKGQEVIGLYESEVYFIKPYTKQFLDEFSNKSIQTHYIDGTWEKYEKSLDILSYSGFKNIKSSFLWNSIEKNGTYNFSYYDQWVSKANDLGINVYACINRTGEYGGDNKIIDDEEELEHFATFFNELIKRYPNIIGYDIINEPNLLSNNNGGYITEEDVKWYSNIIKKLKNKNPSINIVPAALSNYSTSNDSRLAMNEFFKYMFNNGVNDIVNEFSYHVYDYTNENKQDVILTKTILEEKNLFNNFGGFAKINITEYGLSSNNQNGVTEDIQARKLVQQTVIMDQFDINFANLYNFWNTGDDSNNREYNFGIVRNDYTPKLSYYSLKNLLSNTNGSEYIGTVNLVEGLKTHVYNKDGKPKIIAWSANSNNTIEIDYTGFTAKDIYGNDIENTNGKLNITTSPVYLDNISTKYFYEAISNTALEKYSEFEEKFATEIASVEGLQENINTSKQYLESISNIESETEEIAKQKMQEHFNLGNQILTAYKDKALDVEYVKLSSMLDMLNEIGDSFEDLVTVTAKTRNPDLENTKTLIDNTEQAINNNNDLDIVYPEKILEFSKELYEDSEYINSLEEENDIKTGLIVSYDLHAKYLAEWANTFTNLYIDKYIEDNPVTESYSATSLTNQDVTVTLSIPQDVKITNNEGSNTYTFTENGTFTFEYERRGKTDSKLVSVNYIDKTSPEITNVENGEVYTQSVSPNVSDEHLDKVQLTFRGQVIEDYEVGDELTEEGDYKLTATDTVGNTSTFKFYIMKEDSTYKIKDSNILNIRPETTVKDFKENFTVIEGYTIKREDTELTDEDVISTGDVLEETDGNKFTLIVRGDLNCDGRLSIVDLSIGRKYLLGIIDIDEVQKLSSDMNTDEETSLMDLSIMRKTILGIIK